MAYRARARARALEFAHTPTDISWTGVYYPPALTAVEREARKQNIFVYTEKT